MTRKNLRDQEDNLVQNQTEKKAVIQGAANGNRTKTEIEDIVTMVRLHFYNRDLPCGPRAIKHHIASEYAINPPPSERTIARILDRRGLTKRKTGNYDEEGKTG